MASAGKRLEDEELVSYILTGLDQDFDPVVSAVTARVEPMSVGELYTQLVSFEQRMEIKNSPGGHNSSVNSVTKSGRGGNNNSRGRGHNGGGRSGFDRGPKGGRDGGRPQGGNNFQQGLYCQVCGKEGHPAYRCYKRFDRSVSGPPQKSASIGLYGVDTN